MHLTHTVVNGELAPHATLELTIAKQGDGQFAAEEDSGALVHRRKRPGSGAPLGWRETWLSGVFDARQRCLRWHQAGHGGSRCENHALMSHFLLRIHPDHHL